MDAIAALVEAEVARFPDEVGHVLALAQPAQPRLTGGQARVLAWKGRDAMTNGAAYCMKLINAA